MYIKGIDGLRAFAVLSVMIYHINPSFLQGGFTGVDIFFVISGYVVSSSLYKQYNQNFFHFITTFYAKRILRIVPALLVFLLISSFVTTLFIPHSWLSGTTPKTALAAFFGYSNFALVWYNDGYFSPRVDFNPFAHTWSLGVEEQFYVIFPLLFSLWLKFKEKSHLINIVSLVLLFLSLAYSAYMTFSNPTQAFYFLPSRFWELLAGALLFKLHHHTKSTQKTKKNYFTIGMGFLFVGFVFSDANFFPFPWAIASVIGTLFIIHSLVITSDNTHPIQKILQNDIIVYIGKISYSLYLWHWAVYVLFRWTIGLNTFLQIFIALLLTILLAVTSYHFIEKPIRRNKHILTIQSFQIVVLGLLTIFVFFFLTKYIFKSQSTLSLSKTKNTSLWYPHAYKSKKNYKTNSLLKEHKLFVFGDSHALAYSTMLQKLSDEYGIKIYKFSSGNCPVADLLTPGMSKNPQCQKYTQNILSRIEKLASPNDTIFLASLRMNRLADQWSTFSQGQIDKANNSKDAIQNRKLALNETKELITRFEKLQLNIIIDAPKPVFKSPPFRCSDWFNKNNPICSSGFTINKDFLLDYRKPVMDSLSILKNQFPKLIIWDPFTTLCPQDICNSFDGQKPLFFDADHLSAHGNRVLYPSFSTTVKKVYNSKKDAL